MIVMINTAIVPYFLMRVKNHNFESLPEAIGCFTSELSKSIGFRAHLVDANKMH